MKFIKFLTTALIILILTACSSTSTMDNQTPKKITLDNQMNDLTRQIISSFKESKIKKIAVIEFADLNGNVTNLGAFIAEELITRIFMTNKFEVVERNLLNKIMEEQKLGTTGFIDEESAISIGQVLGVEAIVTGSITDLGDTIKINARLISTKSGSIFSVASVSIPKDYTVRKLLGANIQKPDIPTEKEPDGQVVADQEMLPELTQVKQGIKFDLLNCFHTGEFLSVIFQLTNETPDKQITLYDRSGKSYVRIIDDKGREFKSPEITLGTHKTGWNGIEDITAVEGVQTQLIYKFRGIKTKPELLKRMDILLNIPELNNTFEIIFRDIKVSE